MVGVVTCVKFSKIDSQIVNVKLYLCYGCYLVISKRDYDSILTSLNKKSLVGEELTTVEDLTECLNAGGFWARFTFDDGRNVYNSILTVVKYEEIEPGKKRKEVNDKKQESSNFNPRSYFTSIAYQIAFDKMFKGEDDYENSVRLATRIFDDMLNNYMVKN